MLSFHHLIELYLSINRKWLHYVQSLLKQCSYFSSCCWQDLDAFHEDVNYGEAEREHYYAAAPSGWDDPRDSEVLPPYMSTDVDPQDYHQGLSINRGDSFVSPAMFVWDDAEKRLCKYVCLDMIGVNMRESNVSSVNVNIFSRSCQWMLSQCCEDRRSVRRDTLQVPTLETRRVSSQNWSHSVYHLVPSQNTPFKENIVLNTIWCSICLELQCCFSRAGSRCPFKPLVLLTMEPLHKSWLTEAQYAGTCYICLLSVVSKPSWQECV